MSKQQHLQQALFSGGKDRKIRVWQPAQDE